MFDINNDELSEKGARAGDFILQQENLIRNSKNKRERTKNNQIAFIMFELFSVYPPFA